MNELKLAAILILAIAILSPSAKALTGTGKSCSETLINTSEITSCTAYESGDMQAKRYALYIFCAALILLILSMRVKGHESTEGCSKGHT